MEGFADLGATETLEADDRGVEWRGLLTWGQRATWRSDLAERPGNRRARRGADLRIGDGGGEGGI